MRWSGRFARWLRRKRREYRGNAILREFVYLDEVSVYSLLASRSGPVATEFTRTESESLKDEVSGGVRVTGAVAAAEVRSRMESSRTTGSQVVRKSSAQARFKQLLDDEQDQMALRAEPRSKQPSAASPSTLARLAAKGNHRDWVLEARMLSRGDMLELEVELQAEEIYRVAETFSSILEILQEDPELFGVTDRQGMRDGAAITRLLDQLLVGLVPIRARASTHSVLRGGELELIVRDDMLEDLDVAALDGVRVEPLYVVGMTETGLYWKDIRRILFSRNRYLALCRLGQDGLREDWTAIKLVDVLRDVAPEVAQALDSTGRGLLSAVQGSTSDAADHARYEQMNRAIAAYAIELGEPLGVSPTSGQLHEARLLVDATSSWTDTVEGRRALLAPVKTWVEQRTGATIDAEAAARARSRVVLEVLDLAGAESSSSPVESPVAPPGPCLESEFIAIYW